MAHLDALGVTSSAGCVVEHVDVVALNELWVQRLAGLTAGLAHLVECEHSDLVIVLGALFECLRLFVGIKHDNVFYVRCITLVAHAEHLFEVRRRQEHRLQLRLLQTIVNRRIAHRVVEADDRGLAHHGGEHSCVPLPSVLRPDSAEGPLLAVFIDAWNRLK